MTDPQVTSDPASPYGEEVETPTTNHFGVGCVIGVLISFVLWALLIIVVAQIIQVLR